MPIIYSSGGSPIEISPGSGDLRNSSVPLSAYGAGRSLELIDGGTVSYAHLYATQVWVAVMVHKISRQISRLPLKAYKRNGDGVALRARTGALGDLLRQPFPGGGPTHLKQALALPTLVHGNSALRKVRQGAAGPITSLQPLLWSHLTPHRNPGGPVELWESSQPGVPRYIDAQDIIHVGWRGLDGPIGVSPLQQLGVTLRIEDAAQRYQQALFRNGARPPSALTTSEKFLEAGIKPDERQAMLAQLRADATDIYGGVDQQGIPAILPPGVDWKGLSHTAVEAELIDQRKVARDEVAACYDLAGPLVNILDHATFSNITELHSMLYTTILGPWLTLFEETLQVQLIDPEPVFRGDVFLEFDLSEVLKGDLLKRAQALALQIGYGVLTIDEARAIENRPAFDLPETTVPLYPANNLKPVGMAMQDETTPPSDADVQSAAKAVATMEHDTLRRLLKRSGGSVITAILDLGADSDADLEAPDRALAPA